MNCAGFPSCRACSSPEFREHSVPPRSLFDSPHHFPLCLVQRLHHLQTGRCVTSCSILSCSQGSRGSCLHIVSLLPNSSSSWPDCGVAQGIVHGVTGHHGKKQEEEEGEVEQEVEGNKEEDSNQIPVRMTMTMDEMERRCEALSQCDSVNRSDECNASKNGAQCAQCCVVNSSVCVVPFTLLVTLVSM